MRVSLPPAAAPLDASQPRTSAPELVAIVASLMALNAFAIDVMLPALRLIATGARRFAAPSTLITIEFSEAEPDQPPAVMVIDQGRGRIEARRLESEAAG